MASDEPVTETAAEDAETYERRHLEQVKRQLQRALQTIEQRLNDYAREVQQQKEYLWEGRADMDHAEKVSTRESIERAAATGEAVQERQRRLAKLRRAPYFGRFDFAPAGGEGQPVYIGIHHFHDDDSGEDVIHDWRAPIASLFYDYETGPATYHAPEGAVEGEVLRKRQFRIRDGEMAFMIESSVNVVDEVLQEELARSSDEGMRNIVATIQRDQNAIIRDADAPVLVIQGVAGSGKTSIALHRIAFLLYHYKESLSSDDILILSPNRVFSDYIADVLPELGEEAVHQVGMEQLAHELLEGEYRFQSFFEQTTALLERDDPAMRERVARKSSTEFLDRLGEYAGYVESRRFAAEDIWVARRYVPGWLLEETFRKHRRLGTTERVRQVTHEIERKIGLEYNVDLEPGERRELREKIKGMVQQSTLRETYKGFFEWLGEPDLFRPVKGRLEYADVFPLIYLKLRLEGMNSRWRDIKHLIVDEMQDYTPVQYAVLGRLFACNMTILGDASQAVNPVTASDSAEIQRALRGAVRVKLTKSYRSSYEITRFAQRILPDPELEALERHGEEPEIIACRNRKAENATLCRTVEEFLASDHNHLGVITRTQRQARQVHKALADAGLEAQLVDEETGTFGHGVLICSAHLAKGLEFDRVVVPMASADNYASETDRHLLYVACTRAMHRLTLTHTGAVTPLIGPAA
ncbi:DNA helicase-2 / ATP-dependent DNA helicase PcrA [Thiohalospira halophila DSM 15071]|uniref:DNA 3'-5' helicase n=1 Tax=Thiohalospira halophila DSM 15071 TaxID=1123397 RepID=A0A1I1V2Q5_9GAMM|nr:3'-5' exonuclease [Thiohalospira halophila]SFD76288.1 DNA helicase-2 / ATP-dependent DNA helicase PcrA [Thiohalospira halophila DSM 15071]